MSLIAPQLLESALLATHTMVRLLDRDGNHITSITPAEVPEHYATGAYQAGGSRTKIKYLRQIGPATRKVRVYKFRECWRTTGGSSALPITPEWLRSVGYEVFGMALTRYNASGSQ